MTAGDGERAPRFDIYDFSTRDISLEELKGLLTIEEVEGVDDYQTSTEAAKLIDLPVPDELCKENPEGATALCANRHIFEDDIEDIIDEDDVISSLLWLSGEEKPSTREASRAIRVRRNVIAFILDHSQEA